MAKKESTPVNCLRNEKVTVRFIKRKRGFIDDPQSPLFGGLAESSKIVLTVPRLSSGVFKNVLTDNEKDCIEQIMGLPENSLSVYKKDDNYWSTATQNCINSVTLTKRDLILNLNDVNDYIRYKILLANEELVCKNIEALEDDPRPTYMFVLINENQEAKSVGAKANVKFECYTGYGKYKDDRTVLRHIIETFSNRKVAPETKIEHLQSMVVKFIDSDPKRFKTVIEDPLLEYKGMIRAGVEKGLIANRNNLYFWKEDNSPLCEDYEEPRFNVAAKYLANPMNQDLRDKLIIGIR